MVQLIALIAVFISVWIFACYLRPRLLVATANARLISKITIRAISYTLCYGIGGVGGEGFALPSPITASLVFYFGWDSYRVMAVAPFLFWFAVFFVLHWSVARGQARTS